MELYRENKETQQVLDGFFGATAKNSPLEVIQYMDENVDFYIAESPHMPWTGMKKGKKAVLKALEQLIDAHDTTKDNFEMNHIFIDGSEAAVFGKAGRTVKGTGKAFKENFCMKFTIHDGLITKFLMLEDSHLIEKAFIQN
ncbi:hypothetical protein PFY10_05130 [Chryseobacterium daecheongense]|nr:hypothetical protein PFY10_05130 [Chryseobacterium daecheongense]